MTPQYSNGFVPSNLLVVFNSGYNARDGNWTHSFPPATYARHLALIARGLKRTGRKLALNYGWTAYRPFAAQVMLKRYYTSIGQPMMAATEGTSSHGGKWEGRQTMAGDYSNWAWVYQNHGGRAAFAEDCRAVGLLPNMIVPARGYPDEPWHVIDPDPWGAVPAFDGVVLPFAPTPMEDDMYSDADRARDEHTAAILKNIRGSHGHVLDEGDRGTITDAIAGVHSLVGEVQRVLGEVRQSIFIKAADGPNSWDGLDEKLQAIQRKLDGLAVPAGNQLGAEVIADAVADELAERFKD